MANSTITINYEQPGTTPPIFVAGSFTEPPWQPIELDYEQVNGEYIFSKSFEVVPGRHQYKFRIGHGDWWVCDDAKDTEIDGAGNVNNVMTVQQCKAANVGQLGTESPDCDEGAGASTQTASSHCKTPPLGFDGINNSDEDLAKSLRKEAALTENTAVDFHGANGDIEPCDSEPEAAKRDDPETLEASNAPTNGLTTKSQQKPVSDSLVPVIGENESSISSKTSAEPSQRPTQKDAKVQDGEEKLVSQRPSVSTQSTRNGQKDQKDFWLIRLCRVVVQGVVGFMSSLLCGNRRKLLAIAFTALIIPVLAWTWRSR